MNPLTIAIIIVYPWLWYLMSRVRKTESWLTPGQPVNFAAIYGFATLICLSMAPDYGTKALAASGALFLGLAGWVVIIFLRKRRG